MGDERCGNCKFWDEVPAQDERGNRVQQEDGTCRRYPPSRYDGDGPEPDACYERWYQPAVYFLDWCGEWRAKGGGDTD